MKKKKKIMQAKFLGAVSCFNSSFYPGFSLGNIPYLKEYHSTLKVKWLNLQERCCRQMSVGRKICRN